MKQRLGVENNVVENIYYSTCEVIFKTDAVSIYFNSRIINIVNLYVNIIDDTVDELKTNSESFYDEDIFILLSLSLLSNSI